MDRLGHTDCWSCDCWVLWFSKIILYYIIVIIMLLFYFYHFMVFCFVCCDIFEKEVGYVHRGCCQGSGGVFGRSILRGIVVEIANDNGICMCVFGLPFVFFVSGGGCGDG